MRAFNRGLRRQLGRRLSSTTTTTTRSASSVLADLDALKRRPAKVIPDYLAPTASHLLATTLADLVPLPPGSGPSSPRIQDPPRALPPAHHLVYFPLQLPGSGLAADGADPAHCPGGPFRRRVWAGGEVDFAAPLCLDGRAAVCVERIEAAVARGSPGAESVAVHVWRRYGRPGAAPAIAERRTLVFLRDDIPPPPPPSSTSRRIIKYAHAPSYSVSLTPSAAHLFHFSALTFNAHAIHVDADFARRDGHRARLVHGPLTLALMLRVLDDAVLGRGRGRDRDRSRAVRRFTYRNHAPLYVDEEMTVCLRRVRADDGRGEEAWDVWIQGPDGGLAVKGSALVVSAELEPPESESVSTHDAVLPYDDEGDATRATKRIKDDLDIDIV